MQGPWKFLRLLPVIAALVRCSSGATLPAPLAEIPSAVQFPESVSVNVDTVRSDPAPASAIKLFIGSGGVFSDEIAFGPNLVNAAQGLVDNALKPLSQLVIPVDPTLTHLEKTVRVSVDPTGVAPPQSILVQIDFSNFDLDGDGRKEGCPGNTGGLPICYRVSFDGTPRMAGLFEDFPDANRNGRGRFRMKIQTASEGGASRDIYLGVLYNQTDPSDKMTEIFQRVVLAGEPVENKDPAAFDSHIAVSQTGPDATAVKLLKFSGNDFPKDFSDVTGTPNFVQYLGQWKEGKDFWSGSVTALNIELHQFKAQCALISTGEGANKAHCSAEDIDVGEIPVADFLEVGDVRFPANFSSASTF